MIKYAFELSDRKTTVQLLRFLVLLLMAGVLFSASGCTDEDCPVCPETPNGEFEIVLTCVDEAGEPLANVSLGATPAMPESVWPWEPNGDGGKSMVQLEVVLEEGRQVRVLIRDVEKSLVRDLFDDFLAEGSSFFAWDGQYNSQDGHTPAE